MGGGGKKQTDAFVDTGGLKAAIDFNKTYKLPETEKDLDELNDGYQLKFVGKNYAKFIAGQKTQTVIVPDIEHNAKDENKNSKNIFISGDNLDALKHLENAYTSKVDVIYIDPPYNTGNNFVYKNDFSFTDEELAVKLGLNKKEIERVRALDGKSSHSAWLTFMYPRLVIAKRLLKDTGFFIIAIDHNELANLNLICDEIFNENNRLGIVTIVHKPEGRNQEKFFGTSNEFALFYAKRKDLANFNSVSLDDDVRATFTEEDKNGAYRLNNYRRDGGGDPNLRRNKPHFWYSIFANSKTLEVSLVKQDSNDIEVLPITSTGVERTWKTKKETFADSLVNGLISAKIENGRMQIFEKYYENQVIKTHWIDSKYHAIHHGTNIVEELIGGKFFDFPKSLYLIEDILKLTTQKDSLILDFFAGSGTTADAVMQLNKEDGGSRNYILVQLDEKVKANSEAEKQGYKTIDEISRERIKKAAEKIASTSCSELDLKSSNLFEIAGQDSNDVMDLGFKSFYLKTPNITTLEKIEEFVPSEELFVDDMISPFSAENLQVNGGADGVSTLLTTWLLDDGYPFDGKLEKVEFGGQAVGYKNGSRLYILDKKWDTEATKDLLNRIGKNEMIISTIIVYAYSLEFEALRELKTNLKTNLDEDHKVELLKRF